MGIETHAGEVLRHPDLIDYFAVALNILLLHGGFNLIAQVREVPHVADLFGLLGQRAHIIVHFPFTRSFPLDVVALADLLEALLLLPLVSHLVEEVLLVAELDLLDLLGPLTSEINLFDHSLLLHLQHCYAVAQLRIVVLDSDPVDRGLEESILLQVQGL